MNSHTRKIVLIVIFILIFICFLFSVSYGYYIITPESRKHQSTISSSLPSCTMVSMQEKKDIVLTGDYAVPIKTERLFNSPSEILDNFKYSFTVTNTCDTDSEVTLSVVPTSESDMPITSIM